ncbi:PAS domain S-box protein [Caulobacter hibisci]|uniref:histidine kinase n=1 Tax=Caulobacter hibisci TaxID=2035993 RepID=A0ABS0STA0_9CAUL|nr:PAS domain S-box protein [Caulobacter hibisci]MBI1682885.1 PAS domain S-box protein [Caulobacter hibisci]
MTAFDFLPRRTDAPRLLFLAVAYLALALAGLNWGAYRGASTAVWPASGVAFAALLLGGARLWPAIFFGRLAAALIVDSAPPFWADAVIALVSALSAAVPAGVLNRKIRFDPSLASMRDAVIFILAALIGAAISAVPGVAALVASQVSPAAKGGLALVTWFVGHFTGTLLVAPLILSWSRTKSNLPSGRLLTGVTAGSLAPFLVFLDLTPLPLRTWHLFPVLAWVAIATRVRGVSLALVATAVAALVSVSLGIGPLAALTAGSSAPALHAADFIAITAATLLLLAAATDEGRTQSALARAQATKAAVFDAALDAIVTMTADGRVVDWNGQAERMFGLPRAQAVGRDLADLIVPAAFRDAHRRGLEHYVRTGRSTVLGRRLEMHALRQGKAFPVEISINVVGLEDGLHFTAYLRDLTDLVDARERLAEQDQRLRATYERASVGIAEVDPNGRILKVNEQLCTITGRDRAELLNMTIWDDSAPEQQVEERELFSRQMAGKLDSYALEKTFVRGDGQAAWVELRASRVDGADGRPPYGVRVVRDITLEKGWARQQSLLINELNHRVKNTLTTVQSITFQTLRNNGAPPDLQAAIESRLVALSQAHDVLTRQNWESASLAEIVSVAAAPYVVDKAARLRVIGPDVGLPPQVALGFAMALQELATNALKHGAWSAPEGVVEISWRLDGADQDHLEMTWRETGGPPVTAPRRRGFGTRLLERGIGAEVGGACVIDFAPTGLVCHISASIVGTDARSAGNEFAKRR